MRKETLLVIGFLTVVLTTTAVIWVFAIPVLRPVNVPRIASAMVEEGADRAEHALTPAQIDGLNVWLRRNRRGWVPMTAAPPSSGDFIIKAVPVQGNPFHLKVWNDLSGADWARTIAVRLSSRVSYRVRYCDETQWASLKKVLQITDGKP